jgi:hypothetical protein
MVTQKLLAVSNNKKDGNNSTIKFVSSEENLINFDEKVVDFDENLIDFKENSIEEDTPSWKPFVEKYHIDNIFKKRLFSTANNENGSSAETGIVKESETGNGNGNETAKNGTRPFEFAEPMIFDQVSSFRLNGNN